MSEIITSDTFEVSSGIVASDYIVDTLGEIDVLSGGVLTDSLATNGGTIYVYQGAGLERTSSIQGADLWINGSASDLTTADGGNIDVDMGGSLNGALVQSGGYAMIYADASADNVTVANGGGMINYGGTVRNTVVASGGLFTAQYATAETSGTTVLEGGIMRLVSAGNATDTAVNGGYLEVDSGAASSTVVSGGSMLVSSGNSVWNTTLNDALLVLEGTADTTVLNGGRIEATSAVAINTSILAGSASFVATTVSGLTVGTGGIATLDGTSTLSGKGVFASGVSVVVDGTLAFDTSFATMVDAQVTGLSAVSGDTAYTLNMADAAGSYKLATDASDFTDSIEIGSETLTLIETEDGKRSDVVKIDTFFYQILIDDSKELMLKVMTPEAGNLFFTGKFAGGSTSLLARSVFGYTEIFTSTGELWGTLNMGYGGDFISVGDFNGDGFEDILRTNYSGQFFYDLSNGDGTFTAQDLGFDAGTWEEMGTGDFSGNGIDDILLADPNAYAESDAGQLAYKEYNEGVSLINVYRDGWDMIATGDFGTAASTAPDIPPDEKADMLWQNSFTGIDDASYYGYCTWITDSPEGAYWRMIGAVKSDEWDFLGAGDFNGDGTSDFAMIHDDGVVALCGIQNGTLSYWGVLNAVNTAEWTLAGIGDFNGDGTDDIAWYCYNNENLSGLAGYWQINDMQTTDWGTIGWLA